ncbi:unnamed protein product [Pylaiella littoralis]
MIIDLRPLASTASGTAPRLCIHSHVQGHFGPKPYRSHAVTLPRMVLTQDSSDTLEELSWKSPSEARRETRGLLANGEYDTDAMDTFFRLRPERAWARLAQILIEVCGVLLALGVDQLVGRSSSNDHTDSAQTSFAAGGAGAPGHIRRAVTRLGPNFVKIGQALASRPDLVGEAIAGELLLLQDAMPLFSNDIAREFIYEELGAYPEDIFQDIGDNPVAAASLGQVYKAQVDGRAVAVKVQRPDLLEAVGLDFYVARGIATAITRLSRSSNFFTGRLSVRSDLVAAVDEYGSRLFEELDYQKEAQNMVRFRELYGAMPGILVPGVLLGYSGKRVITSEWIDGEKLVDDQAQVSPADLPILRVGIECTLTQLLDKGFLHADPHGGNLLKTADKCLAYLDFGLVSVIPPGVMDALICATVNVMNRDYVALAKGFPALALMSESDLSEDFGPFAAALEGALDPIVADFRRQMGLDGGFGSDGAQSGFERVAFAQLIDRVFLLARSFNFRVPPYFISNVRALGELEGLAMTADPGFNLISVVYPYVCRRLLTDPSPSLRAALKDFIVAEDGSVQWEVLDALVSDSNFLDERVGAGGETRRAPLDLSLEFFLSSEGAFVRSAVVSDLKIAAADSVSRIIPPVFLEIRRRRRRHRQRRRPSDDTGARATSTLSSSAFSTSRQQQPQGLAHSEVHHIDGGGGDDHFALARKQQAAEREARAVSRRLVRKRALRSARRKPILVVRVAAAVLAAAGRGMGSAVLGAFQGLVSSRQDDGTASV